jgi:hypothetical protein
MLARVSTVLAKQGVSNEDEERSWMEDSLLSLEVSSALYHASGCVRN